MIFLPLRKIDAAQRLLHASIDETPDRVGDVMDYATTKPEYQSWASQMQKASGGKSFGNVRAMHQLDAVGIVQSIDYDDKGKAIGVAIKVVDDDAWKKCDEGVYTGISPGGRYLKRWSDGAHTRYTGQPQEISLVDRPMIPTATFTMLKADGAEEQRSFKAPEPLAALQDELLAAASPEDFRAILHAQPAAMIKAFFNADIPGMAKADYNSDEREAMAKKGDALPDGSFRIATKADLENAVQAYGRAKDKDAAKAHIVKRAKALDATDALPEDWEGSTKKKMAKVETGAAMKKGLGDVARLASALESLTWLASCVTAEASVERDGSTMPARIAAWLADGADILSALGTEETKEAMTLLQAGVAAIPASVMAKAVEIGAMRKIGAAISKANLTHVQAIHDHASELGAECAGASTGAGGNMAKVAFDLATARGDNAMLKRDLVARDARIAELEAEPKPGGPVLRGGPVDRVDDGGAGSTAPKALAEIEKMPAGHEKAVAMTRYALEHPEAPSTPRGI